MDDRFNFQEEFNRLIRERGITLKKISDATGIPEKVLEQLSLGQFDKLPAAPYVHGYLRKIAPLVGFDAEAWWQEIRRHYYFKASGASDAMPQNRFALTSRGRMLWVLGVAAVIVIYGVARFSQIIGKPELTVLVPIETQSTISLQEVTIEGKLDNADRLTINGEDVEFGGDGTWKKKIVLQSGLNTFEIKAQKFLGRESVVIRQIFFDAAYQAASSSQPAILPIEDAPTSSEDLE